MVSCNKKYPKVFKASKILDTFPRKLTFKQDVYDKHTDLVSDDGIGGWCNYYSSSILPEDNNNDTDIVSGTSEIKLAKGVNNRIVIGGSYKKYTFTAYDNNGDVIDIVPEWKFESVNDSLFTTTIEEDTGYFCIKAEYDLSLMHPKKILVIIFLKLKWR